MPPVRFHAARDRSHIILHVRRRLSPFETDIVIVVQRLHPFLILVRRSDSTSLPITGSPTTSKRNGRMPQRGQSAQICIDHYTVKTVVCKRNRPPNSFVDDLNAARVEDCLARRDCGLPRLHHYQLTRRIGTTGTQERI